MSNDFELLVRAYVDEAQALDTAAADLLALTSLAGSVGSQLDGLGQIIGLERAGLDDDQYRALLNAQIRINISGGTVEQINEIIRLVTGTTAEDDAFALVEGEVAEFKIDYTVTLDSGIGPIAAEAMFQARAAGVYGVFEYHETTPIFAFDGAGASKFDGGYYLLTAIRNRGARESDIL